MGVGGGWEYDTVARNKRVPLDTQKTNDLHRKGVHHLQGRYAQSVLTFWTCLYMMQRMSKLLKKEKNQNIIHLHRSIESLKDYRQKYFRAGLQKL